MKKILAGLISATLMVSLLASCAGSPASQSQEQSPNSMEGKAEGAFEVETNLDTEGYQINKALDQTQKATLNVFGPGSFAVGKDGVTDLVSGIYKPGFSKIIERWNELYPNVTLEIESASWDSWQSAITTACLSGDVDVIMHGATMTDLTEDLTSYLEKDKDYSEKIYATASRRTTENPDKFKVSGVSLTLSPGVVWLDKEIFKNYGVDLPTKDWTYEDVLKIAEKLTGKDPVTGKDTYGIQMHAAGQSNLWVNFTLAANALGAKIYEYGPTLKDCKVNYMQPQAIEAFQTIIDLSAFASPESKEGVAVNEALNGDNNWAMLFREGPIAGYFEMTANNIADKYVAISLPTCVSGANKGIPSPHAGDNNMAIYKDSKNKEWAWEFIKFMTTDQVATQWVVDTLNYPNNKDGIKFVEKLVGEELTEIMDYALSTMPENYNNATNDVFNNVSFGSVTNTQITAVDNVINGYATAEQAAQSMQNYVDDYVKSLG